MQSLPTHSRHPGDVSKRSAADAIRELFQFQFRSGRAATTSTAEQVPGEIPDLAATARSLSGMTTEGVLARCLRRVRLSLIVMYCILFALPALAQQPDAGTVERQRRVMLEAAERGDVSTINRVMMAGGNVHVRDDLGRTPLHLAVAADKLEVFKVLLTEGADINAVANDLDTPWLLAGARGRTEMLRLMIPKGPDFSKRNRYGGNALIPACHYGHVDTVKLLIGTKINLDHVNSLGWTCLLEAVLLGEGGPKHQEIIRTVLKAGANPDIADKKGDTALSHARARGFTQIIAILEAGGAR